LYINGERRKKKIKARKLTCKKKKVNFNLKRWVHPFFLGYVIYFGAKGLKDEYL
jgi:hypothetical protein